MKLINYKTGRSTRLGIVCSWGVMDAAKAAGKYSMNKYRNVGEVIAGGERALSELAFLIENETETVNEDSITYSPPVMNPEKIICIASNYKVPSGRTGSEVPVLFSKFNNALAAHKQSVPLPKYAEKVDYEAELVIVIGREAKDVEKEEALSYVFGYTAGNDLSARDLQKKTHQWLLGKTCDKFAPIGPCLVTADELDPSDLEIRCRVNGELRQSGNTKEMIFSCAEIVSYISRYMTLKPGDIIFTGTPDGMISSFPEDQRVWLKSGDEIIVSIEKIGELKNVIE